MARLARFSSENGETRGGIARALPRNGEPFVSRGGPAENRANRLENYFLRWVSKKFLFSMDFEAMGNNFLRAPTALPADRHRRTPRQAGGGGRGARRRTLRRILTLALIFFLTSAPVQAGNLSYSGNLLLTTPNITLVILDGSQADNLTVNPSTFTVVVLAGEKFFVRSNDKYELINDKGITTQCFDTYSQLDIEAQGGSSITVGVTPNTSTFCTAGGSRAVAVAPAAAAAPTPALPPPAAEPTPTPPQSTARPKATPLPGLALGTLLKLPCPAAGEVPVNHSCKAVYYYGSDGKRRSFANEKAYFTWYKDFSGVQEVSGETLAKVPLAKPVTYRPGVRMVKFQTLNNTYAVARDGTLRWIASEALATTLYGANWNQKIDDVSDAFYTNYTFGSDITSASDYSPAGESEGTKTIDRDMGFE